VLALGGVCGSFFNGYVRQYGAQKDLIKILRLNIVQNYYAPEEQKSNLSNSAI